VEGYEVPPVGEQELNLLPINDIKKAVDSRLKEAYARNARVYNLSRRDRKLCVGELVYRRNFVKSDASKFFSAKLAPKYLVPLN